MPRMPRIQLEGALYYVTSRGGSNQEIFKDNEDYQAYLELLEKSKSERGFKLFSFILLPGHLHLLIELTEEVTISDIMQNLNSSYIKYFNSRYDRKGHLFGGRFKLILVEKTPYLLSLTAYMHLNPLKLGLVKDLKEYKCSSYLNYLGFGSQAPISSTSTDRINIKDEVAEAMQLLSETAGNISYEDFLRGVSLDDMQILAKNLRRGNFLGSRNFIKKIKDEIVECKYKAQASDARQKKIKKLIVVGSATVLLLGIVNFILYKTNKQLKDRYRGLSGTSGEYSERLGVEKEKVKQNLEELYRADKISYQAMSKRLEIEKRKVKELEKKIPKEDTSGISYPQYQFDYSPSLAD